MLAAVHGAPGLEERAALAPAREQLVGGEQSRRARTFAAREPVGGHTGGHVEKAEVVVVELEAALDAVEEDLDVLLGQGAITGLASALVRQPELAGPEAVRPLAVAHDAIAIAPGGRRGIVLAKERHVGVYLGEAARKAALELGRGEWLCGSPGTTAIRTRRKRLDRRGVGTDGVLGRRVLRCGGTCLRCRGCGCKFEPQALLTRFHN